MSTVATADSERPYLGLRSFEEQDQDRFFGRSTEIRELFEQIEREPITVLVGRSGLGKTSLLEAGLFPRLRDNRYFPVRIRLGFTSDAEDLVAQVKRRITEEIERWRASDVPDHRIQDTPSPEPDVNLWEYFHRTPFWSGNNWPLTPVLIFDQFEELLTLGRRNPRREAFLTTLVDLATNRVPATLRERIERLGESLPAAYSKQKIRILVSLREEHFAGLEALRAELPAILRNRYRITWLDGEQALDAVYRPGRHVIDRDVAKKVVQLVAATRSPDDAQLTATGELKDLLVEPSILSLFCERLNQGRIDNHQPKIEATKLSESREEILSEFYEQALGGMGPAIRRFVEERLLTEDGLRTTVARQEALNSPGVTDQEIKQLVERRLLRDEERLGIPHLELIHDVLRDAVRSSRDSRRLRERQAEERNRRQRLQDEERNRRQRLLKYGAGACVVLLAVAFVLAIMLYHTMLAKDQALGTALTVNASELEQTPDKLTTSVLLSIEALKRAPTVNLLADLGKRTALLTREAKGTVEFHGARWAELNHDGTLLAAAGPDHSSVRLWRMSSDGMVEALANSVPHSAALVDLDWSAIAGSLLATATVDGNAEVWKIGKNGESEHLWTCSHPNLAAVSLSASGAYLATGGKDGARVWSLSAGRQCEASGRPLVHGHLREIGFNNDNDEALATVSNSGEAQVWRRDGEGNFSKQGQPVFGVAAVLRSQPGRADQVQVAVAGSGGAVRLWSFDPLLKRYTPLWSPNDVNKSRVHQVVFSRNRSYFAIASEDRIARVFDANSGQEVARIPHEAPVTSIAFGPQGRYLVTVSGKVRIWQLEVGQGYVPTEMRDLVQAVGMHALGDGRLAIATERGTVEIWRLDEHKLERDETTLVAFKSSASEDPPDTIRAVTASPDGKSVVAAGSLGILYIWNLEQRQQRVSRQLKQEDPVNDLTFSTDGRFLAAVGEKRVTVWRWEDQAQAVLEHDEYVNALSFSPIEPSLLVTALESGQLQYWTLDANGGNGDPRVSFEKFAVTPKREPAVALKSVTFGARGDVLVTADDAANVQFWRKRVGLQFEEVGEKRPLGWSVVPSGPGRQLFAVLGDDRLRVFSLGAEGQPEEVAAVTSSGDLHAAAFTPDDKRLVLLSGGALTLAPIERQALIAQACNRLTRRSLEREEWDLYLSGESYEKSCKDYP